MRYLVRYHQRYHVRYRMRYLCAISQCDIVCDIVCDDGCDIYVRYRLRYRTRYRIRHRGAASVEPSRTVRTGPNLNSTQNGDPKDTYLQCEGRNKHDEVMYIPKRFCKSLLKSRDMMVCIWHKSVRTLPKMVRTRFEQTLIWFAPSLQML